MFIFARTPIKAEDDLLSAARPHAFTLVFSNLDIDVHCTSMLNMLQSIIPAKADTYFEQGKLTD